MTRTIALFCVALAAPALAQSDDARPVAANSLTIAVGGAVTPRYEGSDKSIATPIGAIRGRYAGIGFSTVGTALFLDLVPSGDGPGTKFVAGPIAHLTLNRASSKRVRDPQIFSLGKIKPAVEIGAHFGVSRTGVITSEYDNLTFDVAISQDVSGIHESAIVTPSINYGTPLSKMVFVGVSVSADYVGRGYSQTYFGVTPAQSVASKLPVYRPDKGFKSVNFGGVVNVALTGDLRQGLSAFALTNYGRLLGQFGRSPVVRDRSQFFGGVGLAYTF